MPNCTDADIKLLIVYALLSRVLSLSRLCSFGLTSKIREIMESDAPVLFVDNFEKVFREKIEHTKKATEAAKAVLGGD